MPDDANADLPDDQEREGYETTSIIDRFFPPYINYLKRLRLELAGQTTGVRERLCQVVATITQQRAQLLLDDSPSSQNTEHLTLTDIRFCVRSPYDGYLFGFLFFDHQAASHHPSITLNDALCLAAACGWFLDELGRDAMLVMALPGERPGKSITLSKREQQVLQLMGRRRNEQEIAQTLDISDITVRNHKENIKGKLGVKKDIGALQVAYHLRLYFPL